MSEQVVVFRLGDEEYAVPIEQVREIINYIPVTKLPNTPDYYEGIINVRGKLIPVINFSAKLGFVERQCIRQIVILETEGNEIGITVDAVTEVLKTADDKFSSIVMNHEETNKVNTVYNSGERIIIILDINNIFKNEISSN